jgi:hypothetical protein
MACHTCHDLVAIATPANKLRTERSRLVEIDVYRCPDCAQLILSDYLGWRGSGIIAQVSEEEIQQYLETAQLSR